MKETSAGEIKIESIDEGSDTYIKIGCHRETGRLERMLRVFQKALSLAYRDGRLAEFKNGLATLHDHKGELTAEWSSAPAFQKLRRYVDAAWRDENECLITHRLTNGTLLSHEAEVLVAL